MMDSSLKNDIIPRLDKADNMIQRGDMHSAKSYFDSAQLQWQTIQKDFAGKYDANHPDIVAAQSRFDAINAKLAAVEKPAPSAVPAETTMPDASPVATAPVKVINTAPASEQGAPSSFMRRAMSQVERKLDGTQALIDAQNFKKDTSSFQSDTIYMNALLKDFSGKYDAKHPDVIALTDKYNHVKAALDELGNQSAAATRNLPAMLSALSESSEDLQKARNKASSGLRDLSSLISDEDAEKNTYPNAENPAGHRTCLCPAARSHDSSTGFPQTVS
jgi:DNA repair ATPase RecN